LIDLHALILLLLLVNQFLAVHDHRPSFLYSMKLVSIRLSSSSSAKPSHCIHYHLSPSTLNAVISTCSSDFIRHLNSNFEHVPLKSLFARLLQDF
jgi:hypothetical protein